MVSLSALNNAARASRRTLAAPVGGWDARSAIADMPEENAPILDNWFPDTDGVGVRRGSAEHATGLGARVESILTYTPQTSSAELFGAAAGNIYDVTSAGAVGAPVVSGQTSAQWQYAQLSNAGGHFLTAVNGVDTPQQYDGTTWGAWTVTGPNVSALAWINLHQRRLFFGEAGSLDFWYLPVDSITGAAQRFPLGAVASLGGSILAMGTWSRDAGDGQDDIAVFVTTEGEAIVYQGIDPGSAVTWALVGVFRIGQPIGRRCLKRAGGDLLVITEDGFISITQQLPQERATADRNAISGQINEAVNRSVQLFKNFFGWEAILYANGRQLLFNVPQGSEVFHQYVFNTITTAPCRFIGQNAISWGLLNDSLYYGRPDGTVYLADSGADDGTEPVVADALQAFSEFGSANVKAFKKVQPRFQSGNNPSPALDLNVDYRIKAPQGVPASSPGAAGRWGIGKWGIDTWGSSSQIYDGWRGVSGVGHSASLRIRVTGATDQPKWISTDYTFIRGGLL